MPHTAPAAVTCGLWTAATATRTACGRRHCYYVRLQPLLHRRLHSLPRAAAAALTTYGYVRDATARRWSRGGAPLAREAHVHRRRVLLGRGVRAGRVGAREGPEPREDGTQPLSLVRVGVGARVGG